MKKIIALCLLTAILLCGCEPAKIPSYSKAPEFPDLSDAQSEDHSIKIPEDTGRYPSSSSAESSAEPSGSPSEVNIPHIPVEKPFATKD